MGYFRINIYLSILVGMVAAGVIKQMPKPFPRKKLKHYLLKIMNWYT